MALTPKRRKFVEEYINCWNATEAAKRAGYSKKTAYSIGSRLLKNPDVLKALEGSTMSVREIRGHIESLARHADKDTDRLRALDLLAKIEKMAVESINLTASVSLGSIDEVDEWYNRVAQKREAPSGDE